MKNTKQYSQIIDDLSDEIGISKEDTKSLVDVALSSVDIKKINYEGFVSLEMFIQANVDTSKDLFTWRNIEDDPYEAISRSFNFLSEYLDA